MHLCPLQKYFLKLKRLPLLYCYLVDDLKLPKNLSRAPSKTPVREFEVFGKSLPFSDDDSENMT